MKYKSSLLFFCTTIVWCAATIVVSAQDPSQDHARLRAYTTVMPHSGGALSHKPNSSMLPLWTFNVSSTRDHNNYSGVMVGRDPFGRERRKSVDVPTQIVPVVITTNVIGTHVNFTTGKVTTKAGVTTLDPTVANTACLTPPNDVPLTLYRQSPIIENAKFDFGGTHVGNTQYVDAFQRANFWAYTQGSDYHVLLHPVTTTHTVYINVPAADGLALSTTPSAIRPSALGWGSSTSTGLTLI